MWVWIRQYKIWTLLLIIALLDIAYVGYINLWKPVHIIEDVKDQAEGILDFVTKDIIELIKVLTPILLPIITWKIRARMDGSVKQATNKVVRGKLKIADRRKAKTKVVKDKRKTTSTKTTKKKKT